MTHLHDMEMAGTTSASPDMAVDKGVKKHVNLKPGGP